MIKKNAQLLELGPEKQGDLRNSFVLLGVALL